MQKDIAIFEPWGLGDLIIALHTSRSLHQAGYRVTIICNPVFVEFVQTEYSVHKVIPFYAPWTKVAQKYLPWRYLIDNFIGLKKTLQQCGVHTICELRGDYRNYLLFKWLRLPKSITLIKRRFISRYDRILTLCKFLDISPLFPEKKLKSPTVRTVACFFGAEWENRRVPIDKATQIIRELAKEGYKILLILQPDDAMDGWISRNNDLVQSGQLEIIEDSIPNVILKLQDVQTCISTDSAWMHIAYLLGLETIGLFGFRTASEWAPPGCKVVCSDQVFPAKMRYKLAGKDLRPLETISEKAILIALQGQ